MKKLKAFLIAFVLFIGFVAVLHMYCLSVGVKTDDPYFGTWNSPYKDLSYNALDQNIKKNDMFVFGSSEFRHGRSTLFHPANFFRDSNVKLVTIGGPWNEALTHTVALGALEPQIKNRRVVMLVSPTWYRTAKGVPPQGYSLRFSETEYVAFLKNKDVPMSVKKYVARRSVHLLRKSPSQLNDVKLFNRVLLHMGSPCLTDKLAYKAVTMYQNDKDIITTRAAMTLLRPHDKAYHCKTRPFKGKRTRWSYWADLGRQYALKHSTNNPFFMKDKIWKNKVCHEFPKSKDLHRKNNLLVSREYKDLAAFLTICRANNIRPMLVLLPMNGYWYDYTGIGPAERAKFARKITKFAGSYGAEVTDLTVYDYTLGINQDAVHPWREGWVKINEALYNFYAEKQ